MPAAEALPKVEEAINKFHGDQKKKIDRAYVIWCCKSARPFSMGETDPHFKKFMLSATQGKYTLPSKKTANDELTTLVSVSRQITKAALHTHMEEDVLDIAISGELISIRIIELCGNLVVIIICKYAGDIWSENSISLFAIMGYWIDRNWQLNEKLLYIEGFSNEAHTGDNIKARTLKGLHERWGIGNKPEDVPDRVHGSTPDEGSNILKAWKMFEGAPCVCHRGQSALRTALKVI